MTAWLWTTVYIVGYLAGVAYALRVARHAYADTDSMLWNYKGDKVNGDIAVLCGLGVLLLPLFWPIIGIGLVGWGLVVRLDTASPMRDRVDER